MNIKEKCEALVAFSAFNTKDINEDFIDIKLSDGPAGLRMPTDVYPMGKPQFCFPCVSILSCSFNNEVLFNVGKALASQCINNNVDVLLAPGVNIKRTPLCGRNFEYFSEDPLLTGILASEYIKGLQSLGIGCSVKHFCCNNREFDRLFQSSEVDYRTIREIYTKAFEIIIKEADPWTIMCSYNPINGINVAENKFILNDLLREKLHFNNVLISDWGAVHDRVDSLKASLDIEFPSNPSSIDKLINAYNNKEITDLEIEQSLNRIKKLYKNIKDNKHKRIPMSQKEIEDVSLNALLEGMVLLKNEDNILPLKGKNIALLGQFSVEPSYCGGGSAQIYLDKPISSLIDDLKEQMPNSNFKYSRMFFYQSCTEKYAFLQTMNLKDGYKVASECDEVVIVCGTNLVIETESYDRTTLKLEKNMEDLINNVAKHNKNVIVVIEAGSAIDMTNWINNVKAVLFAGFGGSMVNKALSLILSGKVSPSGRLSQTFPLSVNDNPINMDFGDGYKDIYSDTIFVGYRYYCSKNIDVLFPFGYGLNYTKFTYENITLNKIDDENYEISLDINNIGNYDSSEVIQIYFKHLDSKVIKANKELIAFKKIKVNKNETENIKIYINKFDFKYFSIEDDDWKVENGEYEIYVSKNAIDTIKTFKIKI